MGQNHTKNCRAKNEPLTPEGGGRSEFSFKKENIGGALLVTQSTRCIACCALYVVQVTLSHPCGATRESVSLGAAWGICRGAAIGRGPPRIQS
eukprot:4178-Pyramimonas_sp.AAC.1